MIDKANDDYERWLSEKIKRQPTPPNDVADCVDCGNPIGRQRKIALPSAVRCIACQTDREQKR